MRDESENVNVFSETSLGNVTFCLIPKENHRRRIHQVLSQAAGFDVGDIIEKEGKRPQFKKAPFEANWSHSFELCVLAYSKHVQVGVDTEWIRPRSRRVAERFFHGDEVEFLKQCEAENTEKAEREFLKLWCRKEAFFKCFGGSFFQNALGVSMLNEKEILANETWGKEILLEIPAATAAGDLLQQAKSQLVHFVEMEKFWHGRAFLICAALNGNR